MFHFPQFPQSRLFCSARCTWACPHVGFPIRTSPAQAAAHTSPELFAVYRVLLRHLTPQAFTVRPCSFSTAFCCVELVPLVVAGTTTSLNIALLFSRFVCSDYALGKEPALSTCPAFAVSICSVVPKVACASAHLIPRRQQTIRCLSTLADR